MNRADELKKYLNESPNLYKENSSLSPDSAYHYASEILKFEDVPQNIIDAIAKDPYKSYDYAIVLLNKGKDVPQNIIDTIAHSSIQAAKYANDILKWNAVPEKIITLVMRGGIEAYQLMFHGDPRMVEKYGDPELIEKYITNPQKEAKAYNRMYHGIVCHSTSTDMLLKMQKNNDYSDQREICVVTTFSNRVYKADALTLIGKTELRMLFDFDVYSYLDDGRLIPTTTGGYINELKEDVDHIIKNIEGHKALNRNDEYHDEGFALPSKTDWFAITGPESCKKLAEEYNVMYIPIEKFKKIMHHENSAKILYDMYENFIYTAEMEAYELFKYVKEAEHL